MTLRNARCNDEDMNFDLKKIFSNIIINNSRVVKMGIEVQAS